MTLTYVAINTSYENKNNSLAAHQLVNDIQHYTMSSLLEKGFQYQKFLSFFKT